MGKKNNKANQNKQPLPQSFSPEEWTQIIADAIEKVEQKKKAEEEKQREKEMEAWQETLGIKDYSKKRGLRYRILQFCNTIKAFWKFSFLPRDKVTGDKITFSLIQMTISLIFALFGAALLFLAVCFLVMSIAFLIMKGLGGWTQALNGALWGILTFVISRAFRMASIELEKIKDRNYMLSLFACVIAIISVVVAIVVGGR